MTRIWDCTRNAWRTVYTRAEVLAHGWRWHAGTAAVVATLGCGGSAYVPPAVAHDAPPPYEQPAPPWYPPAYAQLPPEMLLPALPPALPAPPVGLPIPWGDVAPGDVALETTPVCQPAHHWDGHKCVERDVPEPWSAALLAVGLVVLVAARRK
jgi:hypothetical protein